MNAATTMNLCHAAAVALGIRESRQLAKAVSFIAVLCLPWREEFDGLKPIRPIAYKKPAAKREKPKENGR